MTNKEIEKARDLLKMIEVKEPNELIVNSWWGSFAKDYKEALQIAINVLEQSTQEVLETLRQEILDIRSTHLDSQEFALVRKSDVLNIIDKHLLEVESEKEC